MDDDQFTAKGPPYPQSGFPETAFSTVQDQDPSDFKVGVRVHGRRFGVIGQINASRSDPGTAWVWGPASGRTKFGILGTAAGEVKAGVAGISVSTTQPIAVSNPRPGELTPSGELVGVLGMSGTGPGVKGHSESGDGVLGTSENGPGVTGVSVNAGPGVRAVSTNESGIWATSENGWAVHGASKNDRGGVFDSGDKRAQIRLIPHEQRETTPKLPKNGLPGDLLLIQNRSPFSGRYELSLWLCVPSPIPMPAGAAAPAAFWREIALGSPVEGTVDG